MLLLHTGGSSAIDLDPDGSLVDVDMGAYYAYLELRRLPGAERDRFLVWFEGQTQAFFAGPGIASGMVDESAADMGDLLSRTQLLSRNLI